MVVLRPMRQCIDLGPLMATDCKCYDVGFQEVDFLKASLVTVAVIEDKLVGYFVLSGTGGTKLLRFGVLPSWRRVGIGSIMMASLDVSAKYTTLIPESNLVGSIFLRKHGWKAVNTVVGAFSDCGYRENGLYFVRKGP